VILLVEDNEANQLLASSVLELSGYTVEVAGDAVEAREILGRHLPELILMDIQLPGLDGLSFVRELRAESATANIPVIALTALAMAGDKERSLEAGCNGYISKPIDTRTFASEVRKYLTSS
jgi:two-component system cell cycle response regulator